LNKGITAVLSLASLVVVSLILSTVYFSVMAMVSIPLDRQNKQAAVPLVTYLLIIFSETKMAIGTSYLTF